MSHVTHPQLRPYLVKETDPHDPQFFQMVDRLVLAPPLRLAADEFACLDLLDGTFTLAELAGMHGGDGRLMPLERLAQLTRRLDESLFLEGARFRQVVDSPVRTPRCIGCYEADPE